MAQRRLAWCGGGVVVAVAMLGLCCCLVLFACSVNSGSGATAASPTVGARAQQADFTEDAEPVATGGTVELAGLEKQFQAVAQRVAPSVVAVSASITPADSDAELRVEEMNADRLSAFLEKTTRTVGTGLVIDSDGYILTNEHVVGEAEQIWVTTDDHKVYPAIVVGSDPRADLAMLKVPATGLPVVHFAKEPVRRGQWAIALGNPYGYAGSGEMCMSVGVVSAVQRSLSKLSAKENRLYNNLIQTTAEINPGNSGGPLFNLNAEVIGVTTAVILPQKQTNGIGFAMPVTPHLLSLVNALKEGREVVYAYLGVSVSTLTAQDRRSAGIDQEAGVRVESVEPDSPASAGSLRQGDIVLNVGGQATKDADAFVETVGCAPVDRPVPLDVCRDGKRSTLHVKLVRRKLPQAVVTRDSQRLRWRGMLLGPIPKQWDFAHGKRPERGLMVLAIARDCPLVKQGISQGSIITTVAGQAVSTVADLQRIVNDTPQDRWQVQLGDNNSAMVSSQE
jgi:serine protease Do